MNRARVLLLSGDSLVVDKAVQAPDGRTYVVDGAGRRYPIEHVIRYEALPPEEPLASVHR